MVEKPEKVFINCPLHSEDNNSMLLDFDHMNYHCFGCGRSGNIIELLKIIYNCSDLQAYKYLSKNGYNLLLKTEDKKKEQYSPKESIENAWLYYDSLPITDWKKIEENYLLTRGFDYGILTSKGVKINEYNKKYQIVIPIFERSKFKGYICRSVIEGTKSKYLYNPGFQKDSTINGNYNKKWLIITEGVLDQFRFEQFGVKNVCCIFGWRISAKQIKKIQLFTNNVISALDNTSSGDRGTKILKEHFKTVVRFQFPGYVKDVGEMHKNQFAKSWKDTKKLID